MKSSRKEEIIACCEAISRNVDSIVSDYGYDQSVEILISIVPNHVPVVSVTKKFLPAELIKRRFGGDAV